MSDITRNDFVKRTHDHLNRYIALADNKASILLTAQFAFLGLFANAIRPVLLEADVVWWSALISMSFGVAGVFLSGWVVYPRTPKSDTGLIFWGNIIEYGSSEDFVDEIENLDDNGVRGYLIQENYNLAMVAKAKYGWLRWSLRATAGMVVFAVIAGVVYLFF